MAEFAERSDEHSLAHRVQQASTMRTALLAIFSLAIPVVVVSSAEVAQAQVIYVSPPRVVIHAPPIPLPRFVRRVRVVRVAAPVYYPPPPTVYVPAPPVQIYAPPPEPYSALWPISRPSSTALSFSITAPVVGPPRIAGGRSSRVVSRCP